MDVLVLEDDEVRIRWLRRALRKHDPRIVWTDSVTNLLELANREPLWDLILLDHDLKGRAYNGTVAARYLRAVGPIVVWSLNDTGARRMVKILRGREEVLVVGWLPFGSPELAAYLRSLTA